MLFPQSHSTWSSQTSLRTSPLTLVTKRCSKWGSGLKGFITSLKAALLQQSTHYWLLSYTKLCYSAKSPIITNSKRNLQTSAGPGGVTLWNCSVWTRTSALALFPSLLSLPSLPISTGSSGLEKGFHTTHQGRQGQKLIRTIHKPGWRSAASHPWKFNCTQ